ncbi:hypothetical protein JCM10207_005209 [Rhodosporidiobolus poonsookiae]
MVSVYGQEKANLRMDLAQRSLLITAAADALSKVKISPLVDKLLLHLEKWEKSERLYRDLHGLITVAINWQVAAPFSAVFQAWTWSLEGMRPPAEAFDHLVLGPLRPHDLAYINSEPNSPLAVGLRKILPSTVAVFVELQHKLFNAHLNTVSPDERLDLWKRFQAAFAKEIKPQQRARAAAAEAMGQYTHTPTAWATPEDLNILAIEDIAERVWQSTLQAYSSSLRVRGNRAFQALQRKSSDSLPRVFTGRE